MAAWVDRLVLDWSRVGLGNHSGRSSVTWDPEGVLSTIPAIGTAMLGNLAGRWIGERRPLVRAAGRTLRRRRAGHDDRPHVALVVPDQQESLDQLLRAVHRRHGRGRAGDGDVDRRLQRVRRWTKPFVVYGTNPIVAFVGSAVMARCIYSIFKVNYGGTRIPLQEGIYRTLFASWLSPDQRLARIRRGLRAVLVRSALPAAPARYHPEGVIRAVLAH